MMTEASFHRFNYHPITFFWFRFFSHTLQDMCWKELRNCIWWHIMALCSLSIKLVWLNQRCVVYDHGKPPCSLNGMLWFVVRSARETTMIRPWRLAVAPWDMGVATDATRWDSKSAGAWAMFGRQLGEPLFLIGGRESRPLSFAAFWKYKLGLWMKLIIRDFSFFGFHPLPSRSFRILMVSVSPLKSWRQRERERERKKKILFQISNIESNIVKGYVFSDHPFLLESIPCCSTFQLFDPNFRDVSVGWVCCQMFVAMCSIPLRCSWAEAVAQQLSCGVMWRCKMRVFGPGPCRFGVCVYMSCTVKHITYHLPNEQIYIYIYIDPENR